MKVARALCLLAAAALGYTSAGAATPKDEPEVRYAAMLEREYGPLGKTTEQILANEKTHEAVTVVSALIYRIRAKPVERLSAVERRLLALYGLKEEVDSGGFNLYFAGPMGDGSALALQALRDMGAAQIAKPVQRAVAVFAGGKPPANQDKRLKAMEAMKQRSQRVWGGCDDEFYLREEGLADLALAYVKKNRAAIVLP